MLLSMPARPLTHPLLHSLPPNLQMNAGIILSYFNQRYFADGLSTVCEFIPQVGGGLGLMVWVRVSGRQVMPSSVLAGW